MREGFVKKEVLFKQTMEGGDDVKTKVLTTFYLENLPSQNYKTRDFSRTIQETLELPDGEEGKKQFLEAAEKQQKICETLVKNDIARHKKAME